MMYKVVHVSSQKLIIILITKQAKRTPVNERAVSFQVHAIDSFSGRVEDQLKPVLVFLQFMVCIENLHGSFLDLILKIVYKGIYPIGHIVVGLINFSQLILPVNLDPSCQVSS